MVASSLSANGAWAEQLSSAEAAPTVSVVFSYRVLQPTLRCCWWFFFRMLTWLATAEHRACPRTQLFQDRGWGSCQTPAWGGISISAVGQGRCYSLHYRRNI